MSACRDEGVPALKLFMDLEAIDLMNKNGNGPIGLEELVDIWSIFTQKCNYLNSTAFFGIIFFYKWYDIGVGTPNDIWDQILLVFWIYMTALEDYPSAKRYVRHYKIHKDYTNATALLMMAFKHFLFMATLMPDFVHFYENL